MRVGNQRLGINVADSTLIDLIFEEIRFFYKKEKMKINMYKSKDIWREMPEKGHRK